MSRASFRLPTWLEKAAILAWLGWISKGMLQLQNDMAVIKFAMKMTKTTPADDPKEAKLAGFQILQVPSILERKKE